MPLTLPDIDPTADVAFVLERLVVDLRERLTNAMKKKVGVFLSSSPSYFDMDQGDFVCRLPELSKKNKAEPPAIAFSNIKIIRDRTAYNATPTYVPTRFKDCAGAMVDGYQLQNPLEIVDIQMEVHLFETTNPENLIELERRFFQYVDVYPYLFIPEDKEDRVGPNDQCVLDRLKDQWFSAPRVDLEVPGYFVNLLMPIDQDIFDNSIRGNTNDLFVGRTVLYVQQIPLADGVVLGERELFKAVSVDITAPEYPDDIDEETTTLSTISVGDFKECDE